MNLGFPRPYPDRGGLEMSQSYTDDMQFVLARRL